MAARTKPLKVIEPAAIEALTKLKAYELPPPKAGVKLFLQTMCRNWRACCMKKPR